MIFICFLICILAAFALVLQAGKRVLKERNALNYTLFALSLLWCWIYISGSLRLAGVLPPVNDALTTREITNFMGTSFAPIAVIGFTFCSLVLDAMLAVMLWKINNQNKTWWICGSFFAFLGGLFIIACTAWVMLGGACSIDTLFFAECCASMALPGWALGFTYKEICVIVNIYLEAAACLLSALWLMKVLAQRAKHYPTMLNGALGIAGLAYTVLYIVAFVGIVAYYPPPLDATFDKCYRDLIRWAGEYGSTYNNVNYVIFIVGFLAPVVTNCVIAKLLQKPTAEE